MVWKIETNTLVNKLKIHVKHRPNFENEREVEQRNTEAHEERAGCLTPLKACFNWHPSNRKIWDPRHVVNRNKRNNGDWCIVLWKKKENVWGYLESSDSKWILCHRNDQSSYSSLSNVAIHELYDTEVLTAHCRPLCRKWSRRILSTTLLFWEAIGASMNSDCWKALPPTSRQNLHSAENKAVDSLNLLQLWYTTICFCTVVFCLKTVCTINVQDNQTAGWWSRYKPHDLLQNALTQC